MKKLLTVIALALITANVMADDDIPAFPGAEGHARYTTSGGRGGYVYHVTNLSDDGDSVGSLRWCLKQAGPRTIVFDVSGYIDLESDLKITNNNTTIAGQTAPGDGITLRYYTVQLNANNVIVRFIRARHSELMDVDDSADAIWGRRKKNIIVDHCSFSWSIDETASFYDNQSFTMQWCVLGEGLNNAGHEKGAHGYGGIWGGKEASFHHDMIIHENNRTPRINGARYWWTGYSFDDDRYDNPVDAERVDFRNCVMYNWGQGNGAYGGPGGGYVNVVNNYYKAGPGTKNTKRVMQISAHSSSDSSNIPSGFYSRWYINGNYVTAAGDDAAYYDWSGVTVDAGVCRVTIDGEYYVIDTLYHFYEAGDTVPLKLDEPTITGDVTTHDAETAYEKVLAYCGASLVRDAVDERYMEEAESGTATYTGSVTDVAGIVDLVSDVGGFPDLTSETRADDWDTDGDGMPDYWETANGLNPNDSTDAQTYTLDTEKGWYTNLEVYLSSLVEDIMQAGNADAIDAVDEYYPAYTDASGIKSVQTLATNAPVSTKYYTIDGCQINVEDAQGIFIRVETLANGETIATKVIKK